MRGYVEISAENGINPVSRQMYPVVCHSALGKVVGSDLLGPVSRSHLASPEVRSLRLHLPLLQVIQLRAQHLHGFCFILDL